MMGRDWKESSISFVKEETKMRLNEIRLGTENLEASVNFYTQTLGLKEIERISNVVALQGRDINGCVVLEDEIYEKYRHISFTVDNLDNIVQKLEDADVDVDLENYDDGTRTAHFKGLRM